MTYLTRDGWLPFPALFAIPALEAVVVLESAGNLAPLGGLAVFIDVFEVIIFL